MPAIFASSLSGSYSKKLFLTNMSRSASLPSSPMARKISMERISSLFLSSSRPVSAYLLIRSQICSLRPVISSMLSIFLLRVLLSTAILPKSDFMSGIMYAGRRLFPSLSTSLYDKNSFSEGFTRLLYI